MLMVRFCLFFTLVLLIVSCSPSGTQLGENQIVVDTTQYELILKDSGKWDKEELERAEKKYQTSRLNYLEVLQADLSNFCNGRRLSDIYPSDYEIDAFNLQNKLSLLINNGAKHIVFLNTLDYFEPTNPLSGEVRMIFYGVDINGQPVSTSGSVIYMNDIKRCPPDRCNH
jgi:hypothetical protein